MAKKAFECDRCNEIHPSQFDAECCCPHEVITVWLCDHCEESHDDEESADKCCADKRGKGESQVCPNCLRSHELTRQTIAIDVAGHCSECNPFYSSEQQLLIDDRIIEREEENAERLLFGLQPIP